MQGRVERAQKSDAFRVRDAIDARATKMPLERLDDHAGARVERLARRDVARVRKRDIGLGGLVIVDPRRRRRLRARGADAAVAQVQARERGVFLEPRLRGWRRPRRRTRGRTG